MTGGHPGDSRVEGIEQGRFSLAFRFGERDVERRAHDEAFHLRLHHAVGAARPGEPELVALHRGSLLSAARAAKWPHMPWTPIPGGVDEEQRYTFGIAVAYGFRLNTGRVNICARSEAPPPMSPPTRLALRRSIPAGPMTCRATMQSRKPGANRST